MNTTTSKYEKPEEYWNDLTEFRCSNKDECMSSKPINFDGSTTFFEYDSRNDALNGAGGRSYSMNLSDALDRDDDGRNHKCKEFSFQLLFFS